MSHPTRGARIGPQYPLSVNHRLHAQRRALWRATLSRPGTVDALGAHERRSLQQRCDAPEQLTHVLSRRRARHLRTEPAIGGAQAAGAE
jgi:hypothetical protein